MADSKLDRLITASAQDDSFEGTILSRGSDQTIEL